MERKSFEKMIANIYESEGLNPPDKTKQREQKIRDPNLRADVIARQKRKKRDPLDPIYCPTVKAMRKFLRDRNPKNGDSYGERKEAEIRRFERKRILRQIESERSRKAIEKRK